MNNHDEQITAWKVGRLFQFLHPTRRSATSSKCTPASTFDSWTGTEGVGAGEESVSSSWPRLVRYCSKNKVDPIDYVRRLMGYPLGNLDTIFEPTELFERRRLDVYQEALKKAPYRICLAGQIDAANVVHGIRSRRLLYGYAEEDAIVLAVIDPHSGVRPLMRFCLAHKGKTKRLLRHAESYLTEAVIQYHEDQQQYDRYWGQLFPPGFPMQASEIYERLVGWDRNPFSRKRSKSRG